LGPNQFSPCSPGNLYFGRGPINPGFLPNAYWDLPLGPYKSPKALCRPGLRLGPPGYQHLAS